MLRTFTVIIILFLLAGCGQKGDLYRPTPQESQPTASFASDPRE